MCGGCFVSYLDGPRPCVDPNNFGLTYVGTVAQTISGIPCQRWDSNTPHFILSIPTTFTHNLTLINNYCRNPDQEPHLWCYTTDPHVRWEFCDAVMCGMLYFNYSYYSHSISIVHQTLSMLLFTFLYSNITRLKF